MEKMLRVGVCWTDCVGLTGQSSGSCQQTRRASPSLALTEGERACCDELDQCLAT